jgi:hypothetical protein
MLLVQSNSVQRGLNKNFYVLPCKTTIVLWSPNNNNELIAHEYKLLKYLESKEFPVVKVIKKELVKHNCYTFQGLFLEYIKNANFIKISSANTNIKLSEKVTKKFQHFLNLIEKLQYVIEDLQFLYTDDDLYIIDPSNIHFLQSKTSYITNKINFELVEKIFILQKITIKKIIQNNL